MDEKVSTKIKNELISTGIFLEHDTYQLFHDWKVQGFTIFTAKREYPYSYGIHPLSIDGTVDVLAETSIGGGEIVLIMPIECKKADPKQKHWVFEPHRSTRLNDLPYFIYSRENKNFFTQYYGFPSLNYKDYSDYESCINVFEFNQTEGNIFRQTEKAMRAYYAIKQVNESIPGIMQSVPSLSRNMSAINVVIPVVVTTANLWIASYNPKDIIKASGDISLDKLNLTPKDWVFYLYPNTFQERITGDLITGDSSTVRLMPDKRPTFIVTASALPDFVSKLMDDLVGYFKPRLF